ncbi:MAG: transposase [Blastocatellales bacterium]|nr:transposase [Blastocatellales bacterium]
MEVAEPGVGEPGAFLSVDLGIVRIATDSDGRSATGEHIRNLRRKHRKLRAKLQAKGTNSGKRLLKRRSRKQALFTRNLNHAISKAIVGKAQRTNRGIAIEDLRDIRARVRAPRNRRAELHS